MQGSNLKYFFIGAFVVASGLSVLAAVNLTAFTPGTPIKSGDVNANFSTLKAAVEALQAGTGLADGAVTRAKLAVGGTAADGKVLKLQGGNLVWGDDLTGGGGGAAYSAGAGLSLSGTTFSVNFAGSGSAPTAAKSDHDHFGAAWSGAGNTGLTVGTTSTALGSFGLVGVSGGSDPGAGFGSFRPRAGVLGVALPGPYGAGVYGKTKNGGAGVQGEADGLGTGCTATTTPREHTGGWAPPRRACSPPELRELRLWRCREPSRLREPTSRSSSTPPAAPVRCSGPATARQLTTPLPTATPPPCLSSPPTAELRGSARACRCTTRTAR